MRPIDQRVWHATCMFLMTIILQPSTCPAESYLSDWHHRNCSLWDRLLVIRPSMSSGILWLLSSLSEGITILMATHSSAVQLTKHSYWRLISQPYVPSPRHCWWVIKVQASYSIWRIILMSLQHSPRSWLLMASLLFRSPWGIDVAPTSSPG